MPSFDVASSCSVCDPAAVEEHRHRLDLHGLPALVGEPQGPGGREVLVREEERFRGVVGGRQARGAEAGRRHFGSLPGTVFEGERRDAAVHVVERLEQHAVPRAVHARQRNARARLEEDVESVNAAQEIVDRSGKERPFAVGLAADGPVASQGEEEPVAEKRAQAGVLGQIQPDEAIAEKEVRLLAEERRNPRDDVVPAVAEDLAPPGRGDVLGLSLENRPGRGKRGAAFPQLHDAGIAGGCERAGPEVRADPERVLVAPRDARFGLRERETAGHEFLRPRVELAHHGGVRAAGGEADHAPHVGGGRQSAP